MTTRELCLGALHLCTASGYEIKQLFEQAYRHFQKVSYGSIYPALKQLLDEGLVTCHTVPAEGKPNRKVYSLTDAGRNSFAQTLKDTPPTEQHQSNFLLLILFSRFLSPERMEEVLAQYAEQLSQNMQEFEELTSPEHINRLSPEALMTIEYGKAMAHAQIEFMTTHLENWLQQHRQRAGDTPPHPPLCNSPTTPGKHHD
ncbi:MAG: helix-turn-helix transcriptional regulator [bacterium]